MTLANISLVPFFRYRSALATSITQLANNGSHHITTELKNDAVDMARSRFTGAAVMEYLVDRSDLRGHHIKVYKALNPATCGQDAMLNQDIDRVNLQKDGESAVAELWFECGGGNDKVICLLWSGCGQLLEYTRHPNHYSLLSLDGGAELLGVDPTMAQTNQTVHGPWGSSDSESDDGLAFEAASALPPCVSCVSEPVVATCPHMMCESCCGFCDGAENPGEDGVHVPLIMCAEACAQGLCDKCGVRRYFERHCEANAVISEKAKRSNLPDVPVKLHACSAVFVNKEVEWNTFAKVERGTNTDGTPVTATAWVPKRGSRLEFWLEYTGVLQQWLAHRWQIRLSAHMRVRSACVPASRHGASTRNDRGTNECTRTQPSCRTHVAPCLLLLTVNLTAARMIKYYGLQAKFNTECMVRQLPVGREHSYLSGHTDFSSTVEHVKGQTGTCQYHETSNLYV